MRQEGLDADAQERFRAGFEQGQYYQLERLWSDAPVLHFEGVASRSATR